MSRQHQRRRRRVSAWTTPARPVCIPSPRSTCGPLLSKRKSLSSSCCVTRAGQRSFSDGTKPKDAIPSDAQALATRLSKLGEDPIAVEALTKQLNEAERQQLAQLLRSTTTTTTASKSTEALAEIPEPSRRALQLVALNTAIPFIGFGIMDNAILIIAGDAIDTSLGVLLGISTMVRVLR